MNLNEQMRICRYEPGQYFAPHYDGIYKRSFMEQSQLTIMAYLNDSFTGGHTNFLDDRSKPSAIINALKPETGIFFVYKKIEVSCRSLGMVLIFQHDMYHEGEAVITGKKYIMRR
jgi:hypothetical protein